MKIFLILSFFICIYLISFSQENKFRNFINPPGTNKISDNFYLDKIEVTNVSWWEFLFYIKKKDSILYQTLFPDSTISKYNYILGCWTKTNNNLDNFPVTGITYEQALNYCLWRSEVVNLRKNNPVCPSGNCNMRYWKKFKKFDPEGKYKIVYRLPTPLEFENFLRLNSRNNYDSSIKPNIFHRHRNLYSFIIGNISEMTSEKGIAKGMDYLHKPVKNDDQANLSKDILYHKQEPWLGFRCVAEYVLIKQ